MAGIAELFYGVIDDERTEVILVGSVPAEEAEDGEAYCILALPYRTEHAGSWSSFEVLALDGNRKRIRFTQVPGNKRKGLRRAPLGSWKDGPYTQFTQDERFRHEHLEAAYEGITEANQSCVAEGDDAMEDDVPAAHTAAAVTASVHPWSPAAEASEGELSAVPLAASSGGEEVLPGWVRVLTQQLTTAEAKTEASAKEVAGVKAQQADTSKRLSSLEGGIAELAKGMQQLLARDLGPSSSSSAPAQVKQELTSQADLEAMGLGNLPVLSGRKRVSFQPAGGPSATSLPQGEGKMDALLMQMAETQQLQTKWLEKLSSNSSGGDSLVDPSSDSMGLRSTRERESYRRKLRDRPSEVVKEHWEKCMEELGAQQGEPFSMRIYGQRALHKEFVGHAVLHRVWEMLAAEHALFKSGQPERAYAQNVQNLKATARSLRQAGLWKGAWELTYLPELSENDGGVSMEEDATLARYMKEKAAMEKLLAEARTAAKKE